MTRRKLPIGIQDFESLRTAGFVYVDKTAYVYKLATEGKPYFLGRPRRFGKSLLVSTLRAYFQGQKELFEAIGDQQRLAICDLEKDWIVHPVFHIDMNVENYSNPGGIDSGLGANLRRLEAQWGCDSAGTEKTPSIRLLGLIQRAAEKTGKKVVVLVDEYDKPLLETMDNPELNEKVRKELKAFYGVLKTADQWLRFVFLTGVTKFSQVSVFSDLNQLEDISMEKDYAGICGITEAELTGNFEQELLALGEENGMSYDETFKEMQKHYNGYHFCEDSGGVFNPFSVLNTLKKRRFSYYWFQTGTPTFLVNQLKNADFDPRDFSKGISIGVQNITDYRAKGGLPIPILYQSGYLTIKGYDKQLDQYLLGFPNEEVKYGFLNELLPAYIPQRTCSGDFMVSNFVKDLLNADVDAFMTRLKAFFASIPYELSDKTERYYQGIFYLLFTLMGQFTQAEVRSSAGRADAVVVTRDPEIVYCFEFKLIGSGTAEDALKQIDDKGYLIAYTAGKGKLVKVGVEFDPKTRTVGHWVSGGDKQHGLCR